MNVQNHGMRIPRNHNKDEALKILRGHRQGILAHMDPQPIYEHRTLYHPNEIEESIEQVDSYIRTLEKSDSQDIVKVLQAQKASAKRRAFWRDSIGFSTFAVGLVGAGALGLGLIAGMAGDLLPMAWQLTPLILALPVGLSLQSSLYGDPERFAGAGEGLQKILDSPLDPDSASGNKVSRTKLLSSIEEQSDQGGLDERTRIHETLERLKKVPGETAVQMFGNAFESRQKLAAWDIRHWTDKVLEAEN